MSDINVTILETETITVTMVATQTINVVLNAIEHSDVIDPSTIDHNLLKNYEVNRHKEIVYDSHCKCFDVND